MGQVEYLVWWTVDLAFDSWVSSRSPWFVFENWSWNVFIALEAFVQMSINDEVLMNEKTPHTNGSTMFSGVESVPVPHFGAGICEPKIRNTFFHFWVGVKILDSTSSDWSCQISCQIDIQIFGGRTLSADSLMSYKPSLLLCISPGWKFLENIRFFARVLILQCTHSILVV